MRRLGWLWGMYTNIANQASYFTGLYTVLSLTVIMYSTTASHFVSLSAYVAIMVLLTILVIGFILVVGMRGFYDVFCEYAGIRKLEKQLRWLIEQEEKRSGTKFDDKARS